MEVYTIGGKPLMLDGKLCKVAAGGGQETWVLNEGQDMWLPSDYDYAQQTPQFISNGVQFYGFMTQYRLLVYYIGPGGWSPNGDDVIVCDEDTEVITFANQAYRTITFLEPPTGDLLSWLQNNGVKQ